MSVEVQGREVDPRTPTRDAVRELRRYDSDKHRQSLTSPTLTVDAHTTVRGPYDRHRQRRIVPGV